MDHHEHAAPHDGCNHPHRHCCTSPSTVDSAATGAEARSETGTGEDAEVGEPAPKSSLATRLEHLAYLGIGILAGVVLVLATYQPQNAPSGCGTGSEMMTEGTAQSPSHGSATDRRADGEEMPHGGMPVSMADAAHLFTLTTNGGQQLVLSSTDNPAQVAAVRVHLLKLAVSLSTGDISDPSAVHGADMPGLAELGAAAGRFSVTFVLEERGARLVFSARDPEVVRTIHRYLLSQIVLHRLMESERMGDSAGHVSGQGAATQPMPGVSEEMWRLHHPGTPYPGAPAGSEPLGA